MADDLQRFRCFAKAAEFENFSLASRTINTAQSALSRQIAQLERELGVQLFDRVGRGVRLSEAGRKMQPIVTNLLNAHEMLKATARAEAAGNCGASIWIAGAPSQAALLFPHLATLAAREMPKVKLHFMEVYALECAALLRSGEVNFGIVGIADMDPDIVLTPLFQEDMYILGAAPLPAEIALGCTIDQALAMPLIVPHTPSLERRHLENCAAQHAIKLHVTHEADQPVLASALASDRQGYLIVPESVIRSGLAQDRLAYAPINGMQLEIFLARLGERHVAESEAKVEQLLRAELRRIQRKADAADTKSI